MGRTKPATVAKHHVENSMNKIESGEFYKSHKKMQDKHKVLTINIVLAKQKEDTIEKWGKESTTISLTEGNVLSGDR